MSLSPASMTPLEPVADAQPGRAAHAHDGLHRHGPSCWWDVATCGWHCAAPVAVPLRPQPGTDVVLDPGCPDVA